MKLMSFLFLMVFVTRVQGQSSLNYSGRLVNPNGTALSGIHSTKFDLIYTDDPSDIICSETVSITPADGLFQVNLYATPGSCDSGKTISQVLSEIPTNENIAYIVTVNGQVYSPQVVHAVPTSVMAYMAQTIVAPTVNTIGDVLTWDGSKWDGAPLPLGTGALESIVAGNGITVTASATTPVTSYEIKIATGGINTLQLDDGSVTSTKVAAGAAIARSKLAAGTANQILINDVGGNMDSVTTLPVSLGGTGATTVADAKTNLGLSVGVTSSDILGASGLVPCSLTEKLLWTAGTGWSCIADVDTTADTTKLPLSGGTMTAAIAMGSSKITGLGAPTADTDATTKKYSDDNSHWALAAGNITRASGAVAIGSASAPDAAAILELTSTTLGFLIPRMLETQRDALTAPTGMQIYNLDTNAINYYNGSAWVALGVSGSSSVTSLATGTGLTGGPITATGTVSISAGGVDTTQLATDAVTNVKVSATAAIARSKLATGTLNHVLINNGTDGLMTSVATLPLASGGTGATTAAAARTALGLGTAAVANFGVTSTTVMAA
ncbi:MAG TPA: hypothetical protein VNJ08_04845, partial [Bacteriovoracaceae bacterium]|nr:hypothetical protein [Bacteriovoracaceae bacterium]